MMWSPWQLTKLWGFTQISHSVFSKRSQLRCHHKWPLIWFSLPWPWPCSYNNELYDVIPCSIVFVKLHRFLQLFLIWWQEHILKKSWKKQSCGTPKKSVWNIPQVNRFICNSWVVVARRIGWLSTNQIYLLPKQFTCRSAHEQDTKFWTPSISVWVWVWMVYDEHSVSYMVAFDIRKWTCDEWVNADIWWLVRLEMHYIIPVY